MGYNLQVTFLYDSAFEHDRTRLIDWHVLVTKLNIEVGATSIAINEGSLAFAWVGLPHETKQLFIELVLQLHFKEFFISERNIHRHCLDQLSIALHYSLIHNNHVRCAHVKSHTQGADIIVISVVDHVAYYFCFCLNILL